MEKRNYGGKKLCNKIMKQIILRILEKDMEENFTASHVKKMGKRYKANYGRRIYETKNSL